MQTNYGQLPLVVDPTTGRAKVVRGGTTAAREARPGDKRRDQDKKALLVSNPVPSLTDVYDSKLEAARAHYLGMLALAKDIRQVIHHPFTIELAPNRRYTPDFLVWWADGRITVEEVKGHLKQKNARDSITRLHVAAARLPMFGWMLIVRVHGQWETRWTALSR